jgi:hypothetical protein
MHRAEAGLSGAFDDAGNQDGHPEGGQYERPC